MTVTLAQLRTLAAAIRLGGVGAAARALGLTQSGASQAIAALERTLGAKLVIRTREGVTPTALALRILADAETALGAADRIETLAKAESGKADSSFRVASVPSAAAGLLAASLRKFRYLHPTARPCLFTGNHIEVGEWVRQGIADVGLTAVVPAGLRAEDIRQEELVLVAHRAHPLLKRRTVTAEHLGHEILVTAGGGCEPIIEALFGLAARSPAADIIRAQDVATALELVRQGLGITILPETALPGRDMIDLRARSFHPLAHRRLFAVTASEYEPPAPIGVFLGVVRGQAARSIGP